MAIIKKDGNFMGLPMNIARGNPIPLDKSEIWYSFSEMEDYAKNNAVAYVGQILGLVDEVNNVATAYIILNTNGELQEVGKATIGDNSTIVLENETLSLRDFGKKYYKYIPESGSEEENNFVAAKYVAQEVTEEFPWKAGLEPRVVADGTGYALGWFEPNPTTMEGVNSQIAGIQTSVDELSAIALVIETRLDNTYTKEEVETKIAAAAHLKRIKVEKLSDIDVNADDAEQYIYMVPSGLNNDANKYAEYIVIDKVIEPVGTWEVNLEDYATVDYVDSNFVKADSSKDLVSINEITKLESVKAEAEKNIINSISNSFTIDAENNRELQLVAVPSTIDLSSNTSLQELFVKQETNKSLIDNNLITKLTNIDIDAEKNKINSVSSEFTISDNEERKLSIVAIDGSKIVNLSNNTDFNTVSINLVSVTDDVTGIKSSINSLNNALTTVQNKFNSYVLKEDYTKDMSELEKYITWHEL